MPPALAVLDTNKDGVIDADEIANAPAALKKLDRNNDGKLAADEIRPRGFGGGFGPGPGGPGGPPPGRGRQFGPQDSRAELTSVPLARDDTEKQILAVLDDMNARSRGMMSVGRDDGRLLRILAESLGARNAVELGTSQGYSAVWTALALRSTGGKLTTFEIDPGRAKLARENFKRVGLENVITLVEGDAHAEVTKLKEPIDMVFLDADKTGYIDYLQKLLPLLRSGGLVVAHNMNSGMADPAYVKAITTNPKLETLFISLGGGMSITLKKR